MSENARPLNRQDYKTLSLAALGGALEFYDFIIFVFFAAVVGALFFPADIPEWLRQVQTFGIFAAGYLARPLGGIIMAHFGDLVGRKKMFTLSILLMAVPTLAIGLLPTYASIGIAAPLLLLLMRLLQGAAIGGEVPGAWVFVAEHVPARRIGIACGTLTAGLNVGILLGSVVATVVNRTMTPEMLHDFGWRIPFLLSSVLVLLGLWIRKDIDETPEFKKVKSSGKVAKAPLRDTLKYHWREVLIAAGLKVVETAPFYIFSTFVVSYATTTLSYQKSQALEAVTLGALVATIMIPLMGLLSDKVGRQRMYAVSVFTLGLFIVPWFMLLNTGTTWGIVLATVIAFGVLWAPVTAVLGTLCSEIFTANVRYTGITLGYQLGAALAGGTAPLIATGLLAKYNGDWVPVAWYLAVTVTISLIAIFFASRVKRAAPAINAQTNEL